MTEINLSEIKEIKVLFLHLACSGASYYRIVQFANEMANVQGIYPIYPKFDPIDNDVNARSYEMCPEAHTAELNSLFSIADIVVCQAIRSLKFLTALRMYKDLYKFILVMESDDDPFHIDSDHYSARNIGVGTQIEKNSFDQIRLSDYAIVSTEYLARLFRNYKKDVYVMPNAIDLEKWKIPVKAPESGKITLGWSGASGHEKDMKIVKDVLVQLLNTYPNLYVKFLHGPEKFINHERFKNELVWTQIDEYPSKLASMGFDIAIAPLWDNEFNRAKSNLRYLEYSALGIPTVASNVEPYAKTIEDGKDGFLVLNSEKKWFDKISELIYNTELRSTFAQNAFKKVNDYYSLKIVTQKYADLLKEMYSKKVSDNVHLPANPK